LLPEPLPAYYPAVLLIVNCKLNLRADTGRNLTSNLPGPSAHIVKGNSNWSVWERAFRRLGPVKVFETGTPRYGTDIP
jgi:hypothetical protein